MNTNDIEEMDVESTSIDPGLYVSSSREIRSEAERRRVRRNLMSEFDSEEDYFYGQMWTIGEIRDHDSLQFNYYPDVVYYRENVKEQ